MGICPISTCSSWAWGYTEDCSKAPGPGLLPLTSHSLQTPWRLQTALWFSWSSPARPGGRVFRTAWEGKTLRGQTPGQIKEGGRGAWGMQNLGSLGPGQYCFWENLMHKHGQAGVRNTSALTMWLYFFTFTTNCVHEACCTSCIEVGLVLPQPDSKHAVLLTGIYGVEHHHLPFTLQKKEPVSEVFTLFQYVQSVRYDAATFPWLTRTSVTSTPSSTTWGSLAPARRAKVGRISRVLAISWVTPKERKQQQSLRGLMDSAFSLLCCVFSHWNVWNHVKTCGIENGLQ